MEPYLSGDDKQTIQKVYRNSMRTSVASASYPGQQRERERERGSHQNVSQSLYLVIPLLVAIIRIGAMSDSSARFRNEKHSISNMCTSSMKSTYMTTPTLTQRHSNTHPWNNLCLPFLPPLRHFGVDLLSHLTLYLPSVPCQSHRQTPPPA